MRFRFSLRQLMALVVFVAIGCAGLVHPSRYLASAIFTLTVMALFVAVLAAVGRKGPRRAFWIGFAIAGWGYFWAAHWADETSYFDIQTRWKLQTDGPLLTTKLLRLAHTALHPGPEPTGGGFFSVPGVPIDDVGRPISLPLAQYSVQPRPPPRDYEATLNAFMRIGHSLWTLLFAYLGGLLTRHLYDTRPVSPNGRSAER